MKTVGYPFTYLDCQSCTSRIHCDECEARLSEALLRIRQIYSVDLQMAKKRLTLNTELEQEELEEILEDLGIFL